MALLNRLRQESGFTRLATASKDIKLLCLQRCLRLLGFGLSTIILIAFLSSCGVTGARIGGFLTLTLIGDLVLSFFLTILADRVGRRRILLLGSCLMAGSGVVFVMSGSFWILLLASIFGVISPSGNEIGPFRAVEESVVAQLSSSDDRNDLFIWYNLLGTAGAALGQFSCGWLVQLLHGSFDWQLHDCYRLVFGIYAGLGVAKVVATLSLSPACEAQPSVTSEVEERGTQSEMAGLTSDDGLEEQRAADQRLRPKAGHISLVFQGLQKQWRMLFPDLSAASRSIVIRLCLLFAVDSFASGLVTLSWLSYFFNSRFSISAGALGTLFFTTSLVAATSNLFGAPLARRIGLLRTMVFTHLPSAFFLAMIGITRDKWLAMALLVLRNCSSSMDQAPRQAFLANAVLDEERTRVMGVVNVVKTLAQSAGPSITGFLVRVDRFGVAIVIAGGLKMTYDVALLKMSADLERKA